VKESEMGDLFDFETGQNFVMCLAGASVIKTATLLGVSRVTLSKVMSAYMNHGKATLAKRSSEQKSKFTERDCHMLRRTVLKNHRTTAAQVTAELNSHLEDPLSTKTVQYEHNKSNIHSRASIAKPLIAESNAQTCKRWCHDHNTWTLDNWKCVIWPDWSSFTLFPTSERVSVWRRNA
jgi:transposase